jgi:hypothetical protein
MMRKRLNNLMTLTSKIRGSREKEGDVETGQVLNMFPSQYGCPKAFLLLAETKEVSSLLAGSGGNLKGSEMTQARPSKIPAMRKRSAKKRKVSEEEPDTMKEATAGSAVEASADESKKKSGY